MHLNNNNNPYLMQPIEFAPSLDAELVKFALAQLFRPMQRQKVHRVPAFVIFHVLRFTTWLNFANFAIYSSSVADGGEKLQFFRKSYYPGEFRLDQQE